MEKYSTPLVSEFEAAIPKLRDAIAEAGAAVASEINKGGRPKTVGEPWKALDPPISKAEYYRRKKAGTL